MLGVAFFPFVFSKIVAKPLQFALHRLTEKRRATGFFEFAEESRHVPVDNGIRINHVVLSFRALARTWAAGNRSAVTAVSSGATR